MSSPDSGSDEDLTTSQTDGVGTAPSPQGSEDARPAEEDADRPDTENDASSGEDVGSISDEQLPEDVRPGEENPLASNPELNPDGSTDQTGDLSAPENPLDPPPEPE